MTASPDDDSFPSDISSAEGADASPSPRRGPSMDGGLPWTGRWRVLRWDGQPPAVPTYYVATPDSWDVVKIVDSTPSVAPHPILEVGPETIVLKDEGADDADRERWRVEVSDDTLTVTALTGAHEGAVGIAERTPVDPYENSGGDVSGGQP